MDAEMNKKIKELLTTIIERNVSQETHVWLLGKQFSHPIKTITISSMSALLQFREKQERKKLFWKIRIQKSLMICYPVFQFNIGLLIDYAGFGCSCNGN